MLLGESVYQVMLPQALEVPPFSLAVTCVLKKKKACRDALWLKLNQIRTGHLIRKKDRKFNPLRHTHTQNYTSKALGASVFGSR